MESNKEQELTLKNLRLAVDYSQKDLAKAIGVSDTQLQNYEYGKKTPGFDKAIAMSRALNVSLKTLAKAMGYDITGIPDDCQK
jgi:transcriptional regulator with XRE-family HTH domain